jgi:very-short-patch-repair endonuclease
VRARDHELNRVAAGQRRLITRASVLREGVGDSLIARRLASERWYRAHAGVYVIGVGALSWEERLLAAVLAAGPPAAVSHRAALVLHGLDGIAGAPVEITVPHGGGPVPGDVVVHRSRRPVDATSVAGIPVTSVPRTVLDAAGCLPPVVVEKAMESALRRNLTTSSRLLEVVLVEGGRGVRGTRALRALLDERGEGPVAGSPAEVELLRALRDAGVPAPVRQFRIDLSRGRVAVVDLAWPDRRRLVEVDGLDAHATAAALEADTDRQNALLDAGWQLRRFSARVVRRRPGGVAAAIHRFLRAGGDHRRDRMPA